MSDTVQVALWVRLEAKPGKEKAVADFLRSGLPLVQQEPATVAWFGIADGALDLRHLRCFSERSRQAGPSAGAVAAALMANAQELLSQPPEIKRVDVMAAKLPSQTVGKGGLVLTQKASRRRRLA